MKKQLKKQPIKHQIGAGLLLLASVISSSALAQVPKKFDFTYTVSDPKIQVFDDGFVTRIQIPEGMLLPTIIDISPKGEMLVQPKKEPPYLVIDGLYSRIALRWSGRPDVSVTYAGNTSARLPMAASFGSVAPQASYGAISAPRDTPSGANKKITATTDSVMPAIATVAPEWFIDPQDHWLSTSIEKWAKSAGLALSWSLDEDYPLTTAAVRRYSGALPDVINAVLSDADKRLQATFNTTTITINRKGKL